MLEVFLSLLLCLLKSLRALFLDDSHVGLVSLFIFVGENLVFLRVAPSFKIFLLLLVAFRYLETVERSLQVVNLVLSWSVVAISYFLDAVEHLFL